MRITDIEELKKWYILSNDAKQLYSTFRENNSISDLAKSEQISDLIKTYHGITNKSEKTIEEVTIAYAIIIALTFLEYDEASNLLKQLDLSKLEWGTELVDIFNREARSTTFSYGQGVGKKISAFKVVDEENRVNSEYFTKQANGTIERKNIIRTDTSNVELNLKE